MTPLGINFVVFLQSFQFVHFCVKLILEKRKQGQPKLAAKCTPLLLLLARCSRDLHIQALELPPELIKPQYGPGRDQHGDGHNNDSDEHVNDLRAHNSAPRDKRTPRYHSP